MPAFSGSGQIDQGISRVRKVLSGVPNALNELVDRWMYWEKMATGGTVDLRTEPARLVEDFKVSTCSSCFPSYADARLYEKTRLKSSFEAELKTSQKRRIEDLATLMTSNHIKKCPEPDACHWQKKGGGMQRAFKNPAAWRFAAEGLWCEAAEKINMFSKQDSLPSGALALMYCEQEIMARECCKHCKNELDKLFRITEAVAKERKLL